VVLVEVLGAGELGVLGVVDVVELLELVEVSLEPEDELVPPVLVFLSRESLR
jgi:hypothetical protein